MPDGRFAAHVSLFLAGLFGCAVLFLAAPQIDLAVSGWFFDPDEGFALNRNEPLQAVRHIYQYGYSLIMLISLILLIAGFFKDTTPRLPGRFHVWVLASFTLGAGLIVNLAFKAHWGRARPSTVEEFGGTLDFTPPLVMVDECARNCSFSSGEGAAITTAAIVLGVLLLTGRDRSWQRIILGLLIAGATVGSALRIVMGRHFLSDTLFSALICGLVCLILYRALNLAEVRDQITWRNLVADLKGLRPARKDSA